MRVTYRPDGSYTLGDSHGDFVDGEPEPWERTVARGRGSFVKLDSSTRDKVPVTSFQSRLGKILSYESARFIEDKYRISHGTITAIMFNRVKYVTPAAAARIENMLDSYFAEHPDRAPDAADISDGERPEDRE